MPTGLAHRQAWRIPMTCTGDPRNPLYRRGPKARRPLVTVAPPRTSPPFLYFFYGSRAAFCLIYTRKLLS